MFRKTAAFTKNTISFSAISSRLIKGNQSLVHTLSKQSPVLQEKIRVIQKRALSLPRY